MSTANRDKADAWNGDGGHRWAADADRRDHVTQPVASALFDAARLQPGEAVLDIGCGCGITTLAAAASVRPGRATGIDLSEPMLSRPSTNRIGPGPSPLLSTHLPPTTATTVCALAPRSTSPQPGSRDSQADDSRTRKRIGVQG